VEMVHRRSLEIQVAGLVLDFDTRIMIPYRFRTWDTHNDDL
jgi:hypothetical protein